MVLCGTYVLFGGTLHLRPQVPEMVLCYPEIDNSLALGAIRRGFCDGVLKSVAVVTLFFVSRYAAGHSSNIRRVSSGNPGGRTVNICALRFVCKAPNEYSPNIWRVPNIWRAPSGGPSQSALVFCRRALLSDYLANLSALLRHGTKLASAIQPSQQS